MEWALSMQDDGCVYRRITSGDWGLGLPANVSEPRFIDEKTTRADDPVRDPMDRISLNDANPEPLRGLTVAGPTWHLPAYRDPYASVNAAYPPSTRRKSATGLRS